VKKKKRRPPAPSESQASIVVTVGWMLSVMTTLVCAAVALLVWLVVRERPDSGSAMVLVRLLHFSAVVTACVSLALLPAVIKIRREPPPLSLVVFSAMVAALPILAALL
jgi:hypothetical protein